MARRQIARYFSIPCRHIANPVRRSFHCSIPSSLALSLPPSDFVHQSDTADAIRTQKLAELQAYVSSLTPSPSRVWALYLGTVNMVGSRDIPLELHQAVLRKSTIPHTEIRLTVAQSTSLGDNNNNNPTHVHEERFRTVIRNIRSAGWIPSLDDYHFILAHFAAAGYHVGSMYIHQELVLRGPYPSSKTYGLCLQALAHRLTLPCSDVQKPALTADVRKDCAIILNEMSTRKISMTSANLDLAVRVLKETLDQEAFETLLKVAYDVDLANPDRVDVLSLHDSGVLPSLDPSVPVIPTPHSFSTAALNTVIDMLGRLGNISKLVQAFETLTQPLPVRALQRYSPSFHDDDCVIPPSTPDIRPASAAPNTTTYNILLRHISRAGHGVLARHYILQAIELEGRTSRALCGDLMTKPLREVPAPHFAINRATLLSVFGESNRDKNLQLMRWLSSKFPKILRRKRNNLDWHIHFRANLLERQSSLLSSEGKARTSNNVVNRFTPMADSASVPDTEHHSRTTPAIEVDLDAPPIPPAPFRRFRFDTHIKILRRDIEEIETFAAKVNDVLGRTAQRVKERIGRRVWQNKDVYLLTENTRIKVSRQTWRGVVNFKPRYGSMRNADVDSPPATLESPQYKNRHPYNRSSSLRLHPKRGLSTLRVSR